MIKNFYVNTLPYPGVYWKDKSPHATGLALDNSNSKDGKLQPSLESFWEGISEEFKESLDSFTTHNLEPIAKQGVLLINRSLTVVKNQIGSHKGLWDEFLQYFFERCIAPQVPIICLGKDAEVVKKWIFEMTNPIYFLTHPSFAARSGQIWETNGVFKKVNRYLLSEKGVEINWKTNNPVTKKKKDTKEQGFKPLESDGDDFPF